MGNEEIGKCYTVLLDKIPIGSISYVHINKTIASVGYWLRSSMWGKRYGTSMMQLFKSIVKAEGYQLLTGSILKNNLRSKKCVKNAALNLQKMKQSIFHYFDYDHHLGSLYQSIPEFPKPMNNRGI